jgi:hypothetical protein
MLRFATCLKKTNAYTNPIFDRKVRDEYHPQKKS